MFKNFLETSSSSHMPFKVCCLNSKYMRISQVSFTYQFLAYSHSGVKSTLSLGFLFSFFFKNVVCAQNLAHFVFYQSLRKCCLQIAIRSS